MAEGVVTKPMEELGLRDLTRFFYALKELWRLRMLRALSDADELTVSDLAELLRISQPLVSWHLRRLRQANMVTVRREGRESFYALNREQVAAYQAAFNALLGL